MKQFICLLSLSLSVTAFAADKACEETIDEAWFAKTTPITVNDSFEIRAVKEKRSSIFQGQFQDATRVLKPDRPYCTIGVMKPEEGVIHFKRKFTQLELDTSVEPKMKAIQIGKSKNGTTSVQILLKSKNGQYVLICSNLAAATPAGIEEGIGYFLKIPCHTIPDFIADTQKVEDAPSKDAITRIQPKQSPSKKPDTEDRSI